MDHQGNPASFVLSWLHPSEARPHPRGQDLLPEGPNPHEVITKRANLPMLREGKEVWNETRSRWCSILWAAAGAPAFTSEMEQGRDWI